jgi:hypothetical protein
MKKATKKEVLEMALAMSVKYGDLVWFARTSDQSFSSNPMVRNKVKDVIEKYKDEVNDLVNDNSNWTHGFNSGCLAAFTLIADMMEYGTENAIEEFPFLDT